MPRLLLVLLLLGFVACNKSKVNKHTVKKDSTIVKKDTSGEPRNFKSIHQLEYEKYKNLKKHKKPFEGSSPVKIKF